jgi:hypothetical protein
MGSGGGKRELVIRVTRYERSEGFRFTAVEHVSANVTVYAPSPFSLLFHYTRRLRCLYDAPSI